MAISSKSTVLDVVLRIAVAFVMLGGFGFAVHGRVRADAGQELVVLFFGLLLSSLTLLVGVIVKFYRRQQDGAFPLIFMPMGFYLAWLVLSRLAKAE
jgi:hypothetical protein